MARNGIHTLLRRVDIRRSDDIIYHMWCISLLGGSDMWRHKI